jgi:hypothetical protein
LWNDRRLTFPFRLGFDGHGFALGVNTVRDVVKIAPVFAFHAAEFHTEKHAGPAGALGLARREIAFRIWLHRRFNLSNSFFPIPSWQKNFGLGGLTINVQS